MTAAASVVKGSWTSLSLVTPTFVCEGSLASGAFASDSSSGFQGESASASVVDVVNDHLCVIEVEVH